MREPLTQPRRNKMILQKLNVEAGNIDTASIAAFLSAISKLDNGVYQVDINPWKKMRSHRQNRYMWGVVYKLIADHTGYSADEIHQLMKEMFLQYDRNGHIFLKSTRKLSTKDFEQYLEDIRRFAATDLGIHIPEPNQEDWI